MIRLVETAETFDTVYDAGNAVIQFAKKATKEQKMSATLILNDREYRLTEPLIFDATETPELKNIRLSILCDVGTALVHSNIPIPPSKITKEENSWFEIEAPESLKLYVSEVYLVNGKLTNSVNLRTGRDAKAPSFGLLPAGTKLEAAEENSKYSWIKLKTTAGIKVYAYKDYISPDAKEIKEEVKNIEAAPAPEKKEEAKKEETVKAEEFIEAAPAPAPAPEKKAEVKKDAPEKAEAVKAEEKKAEVKKVEEKKAPEKKDEAVKVEEKKPAVSNEKLEADLKSLGAKFDKDGVSVKGILYNIPKSTTPATNYAVLKGSENQAFVCGLDDKEFKKLEGKEVDFTGKAYRIPGWKAPIVIVK